MLESWICRKFEFDSVEYGAALQLRNEILRRPLGLELSQADLIGEDQQFHFGSFWNSVLVATLTLKPHSLMVLKMRQVAVLERMQKHGIGQNLIHFAENWALHKGYQQIELSARSAVVGFYEKQKYIRTGDPFLEVGLPHFKMTKNLIAKA